MEPVVTRVFCDEHHDIPIFHEVRYYRKFTGDSDKGQNIFMLKPFPRNDLSCKQLMILTLVVPSASIN